MTKRAECFCGSTIRLKRIPDDLPKIRGRRWLWMGEPATQFHGVSQHEESIYCYPDAEGADGRAFHEPFDPNEIHEEEDE